MVMLDGFAGGCAAESAANEEAMVDAPAAAIMRQIERSLWHPERPRRFIVLSSCCLQVELRFTLPIRTDYGGMINGKARAKRLRWKVLSAFPLQSKLPAAWRQWKVAAWHA